MKYYEGYGFSEDGKIFTPNGKEAKIRFRPHTMAEVKINGKQVSASRMFYKAYNPDFDISNKDMCITYKDGNKHNLMIENLEVKYRGDLIQGSKHKVAKLSEKQAEEIIKKYNSTKGDKPVNQHDKGDKTYHSYRSLAREYGVTYTLIKQLVEGKTRNEQNYKLKGE